MTPPSPSPVEPDATWEHIEAWKGAKKAISALPNRFESELFVSGVHATDLFAFNSSLGATIEEQVVASLNNLRSVWDVDEKYSLYSFERQPQTFPDVVLRAATTDVEPHVILGIELKGWYALAKEKEPSFRYKVTPGVCAPADLLVVVPWTLSKVISGSPTVFTPYVTGARYAAQYRNWYWANAKGGRGDNSIAIASSSNFYPSKNDMIADRPASDGGGNFGRLARTKMMDEYIDNLFDEKLAGIPLGAWQKFLALLTENQTQDEISRGLEALASNISQSVPSTQAREAIRDKLKEIVGMISVD